MGVVLTISFTSLSRLSLYIPAHNKVEPWAKLCGTVRGASRYTAYVRSMIESRACIPSNFLVNPNIWHVKVSLVVYATMEMHKSDRVLRQCHTRRPRRTSRNPRSTVVAEAVRHFYTSTTSCTTFDCFYIISRYYFWTAAFVFSILQTDAINVLDDDDPDDNVNHLFNHLFVEWRIYDGNRKVIYNQPWMKEKKMRGRDHNVYSRVELMMKTRRSVYNFEKKKSGSQPTTTPLWHIFCSTI
ncbi:hypothetical protein Goshw_025964 [Gossypium schwendimanii]|uniref:Uncharacterized protein n=1 Tax=Gossypium schwendimanii TaxID=34291 RepID=A0A7J9L5M8_GOSSC|nr:hypothetical protein [Gossypium schwendimanii]